MSYITINNINKSFGSLKALTEINANVEKGELVSLLGPSGCGKSTLLRIVSGLETSDSGNITVNDKDIINVPVNKRNMGMVFQSYSLFPNMTAKDNIAFGLKLKKLSNEEINKRVNDIIELVDLKGRENHYPSQLSGGQQQRVALARALVTNPDVLLLDEPLSALDAKIRVILRGQIREIQQKLKITTIFVTHDQEEALSISDKIFVMEKGIIVQQGTPKQIYQEPKCEFAASFIGTYNFLDSSFLKMDYFKGTLLLRPEHIDIYHKDQAEQQDIENLYRGNINQIFFLGSVTRIIVNVNNKLITVDKLNKSGKLFDYGEEVYLKIDKDKVLKLS